MQSLTQARLAIEADLKQLLDQLDLPEPLQGAVHHAVLLGGKRIRPALVYATTLACGAGLTLQARQAAMAVELIHCYSLVHDDLPCMDDDALRRGQPTCHVVFGEAYALLAADLLQSLAFEVLTGAYPLVSGSADGEALGIERDQVLLLSQRASRMVAGQVLDLQAEGQCLAETGLEQIHRNKTGALIESAVLMGARAAGVSLDDPVMDTLSRFAQALGLAFQVQDDILDVTASTEQLGKPAGSDQKLQKSTYPAVLGLEGARSRADHLHRQAQESLIDLQQTMQVPATLLQEVVEFLLTRQA